MSRQLDALFIQPNSSLIYQGLRGKYSAIETPTWALLLAQSCRAAGYGVNILDCDAFNLTNEEAVAAIKCYNPRYVVFTVYGSEPNQGTVRMASAVPLAQHLKGEYPEYKTVFIGSHTQALPKEVLALPCVDYICQNEGVYTLRQLLEGNSVVACITGLGWKLDGKIHLNKPSALVNQSVMDRDLPGYAWDLLDMSKYRAHFWHAGFKHDRRTPFAALYSSLGCPYKCGFCMINSINRTDSSDGITAADSALFRYWPPEHTLKQIGQLVDLGVTTVRISDEMFTLNPKHYVPILEGIRDRWGDELNLWAYARVDTVKEKHLELFKSAGVRWLCLGIEAGNKEVRKEASKGSFQDIDIRKIVKQIEDAGIDVLTNVIFGLPHDTYKTMQETLDLAIELNTRMFNCYAAMALPGSPLYEQTKKAGKPLPESYQAFGFLSYESTPTGTDSLSPAEVLRFRDDAFHTYWSRPEFQDKIVAKFGDEAKKNIQEMLKVKLKRKLLGD